MALQGPKFDGHAFVADALARGAAAAVVARTAGWPRRMRRCWSSTTPSRALQDLGRAARARAHARIVGVTGSVGKTGVKEALRLVLGRQGATHASVGSLNNHWGVPLSLARMSPSARFAVFEMGMNHAGEIAPLTRLVRPHVAVITTVEAVHMENFPSVEAIADAKAEIFLGLERDGAAVLDRDNPHFERLRRLAREAGRRPHPVVRSRGGGRRPAARGRQRTATGATVRGRCPRHAARLPGRHRRPPLGDELALASWRRSTPLGADVEAAAAALADLRPPKGRGLRTSVVASPAAASS